MSQVKKIDLIIDQVHALSLPYITHALAPRLELAEIYLDLIAQKKAGPETTIATALTLLQVGVGHHYRGVWPLIHEKFLADIVDPGSANAGRAERSGLEPDNKQRKVVSEDERSDIDLAIGDYFYASAIKVVSSLGLIDIIEASTVAIMKISSGYRKFDDLMQNVDVPGPQQITEICRECGALYFLAHELAHLTPTAGSTAEPVALADDDLNDASGVWFRREVETYMKIRPDGQNIPASKSKQA